MKALVISDIHGALEVFMDIITKEKYDKILFLGDICDYSYSPNNELLINKLNSMSKILVGVCGNCDRNIKSKLSFELPILNQVIINNLKITLTHGDLYNENTLPDNYMDIFLRGHSHVSKMQDKDNIIFLNPGSISKPRGNSVKSYMLITEENIYLKDIDGNIIDKMNIKRS